MASDYSADSIIVLEGLEPVRRRPGMYIGDVHDGTGLHHMLWEVVANAVDLHLAGKATHLSVRFDGDWVEVQDDGPGFPLDQPARHGGRSVAEIVLTTLHCGATYDGHFPHVHLTLAHHGVGLAAVNALSAELELETRTRGGVYRARFARGEVVEPLTRVGASDRTGTRMRFRPDPEIFTSVAFDHTVVRERLKEVAYLNPMLTVELDGERFRQRDGIAAWVYDLAAARGAPPTQRVRRMSGYRHQVHVDVALTWLDEGPAEVLSFASQAPTIDGRHLRGFWEGLKRALAPELTSRAFQKRFGPGLVAVVHAGLYDPVFAGPTRERLQSPEAQKAVREIVEEGITRDPELRESLRARLS